VGNFKFPAKSCDDNHWIVVRTDAEDSALPVEGSRLTPCYAGVASLPGRPGYPCPIRKNVMAALVSNAKNEGPVEFEEGANHYRLLGLEITRNIPGSVVYNLVVMRGKGGVHHLVFDRDWIHGTAQDETTRGIALGGSADVAVVDSYFSDFHCVAATGACVDSQTISGGLGDTPMGPYKIVNNFLEASGENIMFGGAQPAIPGLVPSDIAIEGNYFLKPLSWQPGNPAYAGTRWSVKNLLEMKNAQRVRISGNVFENNWASSQSGFAILFTVRASGDPTAVVKDLAFRDNLVSNTPGGVNILGIDDSVKPAVGQTSNIVISNNLFTGVANILFQILAGAKSITFAHNTGLQGGSAVVADGLPSPGLVFRDNMIAKGTYGFFGSGAGSGTAALKAYFPGYVFQKNVVIGADPEHYPPGNYYPKDVVEVGFADYANGNLALGPGSRFARAGSEGSAPGADVKALQPVFEAARSGRGPLNGPPSRPSRPAQITPARNGKM
jgi:hypothetical protein